MATLVEKPKRNKGGRPPGKKASYRPDYFPPRINYNMPMRILLVKAIVKTYILKACTIYSACLAHGIGYSLLSDWTAKYPLVKKVYQLAKLLILKNDRLQLRLLAYKALNNLLKLRTLRKTKIKVVKTLDADGDVLDTRELTTTLLYTYIPQGRDALFILRNTDDNFNNDVVMTELDKIKVMRVTPEGIVLDKHNKE